MLIAIISAIYVFHKWPLWRPLQGGAPSHFENRWSQPCHFTTIQFCGEIYKAARTGTQLLAQASTASSAITAWKPLPGTSLSAVQYSTVRNTTDRVCLSFELQKLPGLLPWRATGREWALHK